MSGGACGGSGRFLVDAAITYGGHGGAPGDAFADGYDCEQRACGRGTGDCGGRAVQRDGGTSFRPRGCAGEGGPASGYAEEQCDADAEGAGGGSGGDGAGAA